MKLSYRVLYNILQSVVGQFSSQSSHCVCGAGVVAGGGNVGTQLDGGRREEGGGEGGEREPVRAGQVLSCRRCLMAIA